MAVGRGVDDRLGGEVSPHAASVFDHESPAKMLRQPFAEQPRDKVGASAGRKSDNHLHRTARIVGGACRLSERSKGAGEDSKRPNKSWHSCTLLEWLALRDLRGLNSSIWTRRDFRQLVRPA